MPKATASYTEIEIQRYEHIGNGKVLASFKTIDGEEIKYLMKTSALFDAINRGVACVNANLSSALRDIGF